MSLLERRLYSAMRNDPSRRRVLRLFAATAGLTGLGLAGAGLLIREEQQGRIFRWRGRALGAPASLLLHHRDRYKAAALAETVISEVERLERIFSLYLRDSALSRLNREGRLSQPPFELVELLRRARRWSVLTGGVFDVTIQPLWTLHRRAGGPESVPDSDVLAHARWLVDYRALEVERHRVAFTRPGMSVTLNGIAQGYITDRVTDLLGSEGQENILIDMGELRALGGHPDGRPWLIGRSREPRSQRFGIRDSAVASSGMVEPNGGFLHHFDPVTGAAVRSPNEICVMAERATDADALSTALAVAGRLDLDESVLSKMGIQKVIS